MDLSSLLARVEAATGPDRELDVAILGMLDACDMWSDEDIKYAAIDPERTCAPDRYTASLDAALALVERCLPGHDWSIGSKGATCVYDGRWFFFGEAASPCIALLAALLRALIAREAKGGAS